MNRIFLNIPIVLFFLLLSRMTFAQQEFTTHFVHDMLQANYSNPSFKTEYSQVIGIPGLVYNYGNNAFSYNDLVKSNENGSTYLDFDGVLENMSDKNIMQIQLYTDIFSVYFIHKKWYFTINMAEKFDFKFSYPKNLIDLLWNGNSQYIGQTVEIGPAIDVNIYKEVGIAAGRNFGKYDLGVRLKFINGLTNITSSKSSLTLHTGADNYATTLNTDYEVRTSGVDNIEDEIFSPIAIGDNFGMGIDFGINYRLNDKWQVALSIVDLGVIRWDKNVVINKSKGSFTYSGVDLAYLLGDDGINFENYTDSLSNLYFEEEKGGSYDSYLVPKTYISGRYKLNDKTTFGALVHLEYFDGIQPGFALYMGHHFNKFLDLGLSYSIKNRQYDNVGFNLGIGPRAVKFYVVTDNMLSFLRAGAGRNVTFRYAININLGYLGKNKKKDEPEG